MLKIFLKTNLTLLLCLMTTAVLAQTIIYVKPAATGTGDGSSWTNATTLQPAIDAAAANSQIWVAAGTYLPTFNPVTSTTPSPVTRDVTFFIYNKKVELYGGFAGTNGTEANFSSRNVANNPTILSGNFNGDGTNNAFHVLVAIKAGATIIDGFTVTNPNGAYTGVSGGAAVTIDGQSLPRNNAGGFFISGTDNNMIVRNCIFQDNRARGEGGAIKVQSSSVLTISDCTFLDNKVSSFGAAGAIMITTATVTIDRSKFINNENFSTSLGGGAIYSNHGASVTPVLISNSLFYGNKASSGGALLLTGNGASTMTISGTTIYGNSASTASGGAIVFTTANPILKIYNSIIYANTANSVSNDVSGTGAAASEIKNSFTQGYNPASEATVQTATNPSFVSTNSADATFLQLQPTSPARQQGDVALANGTLDLAGNPRTQGGVDLGAYQSATTLPVEFESFDAKKVAGGAQLTWKVLSETNNEKFVVERSGDRQNFNVIASVVSKGNTNQAATYSYLDNAPLNGKNYYRLSQVDRDAVSNVLSIKVLDFEISESAIQVYPNPVTDVVRVKAGALQNSNAKVSLYSLAGAELLAKQISKSEAEQGFDLDIRSFNAGTYILVVNKGNVTQKTKIIITK